MCMPLDPSIDITAHTTPKPIRSRYQSIFRPTHLLQTALVHPTAATRHRPSEMLSSSALFIAALVPLIALASPVQIPLALSSHSNVVSSSDASYTFADTPDFPGTHETYGSLVAALAAPRPPTWPLDVDSAAKMEETGQVGEREANSGEEEGLMGGVCPDLTVRCVLDGNWAKPVGYIGRKRMSLIISSDSGLRLGRTKAATCVEIRQADQDEVAREMGLQIWARIIKICALTMNSVLPRGLPL